MSFAQVLADTPVPDLVDLAARATRRDVDTALARERRDLADFAALLSPAAGEAIEDLARASHAVTERRFGRTVHLYAPLYLSNECLSTCAYCGFARTLSISRRTLSVGETRREATFLRDLGFRHLLLLTGEHERLTGVDFLCERVTEVRDVVPQVSVEVQVWDEDGYRALSGAGCDGVVIYQETYDPGTYSRVHLAGRKRRYAFRLDGPERAAAAGIRRLGIGALLGLREDWVADALCLAVHALHLQKVAWRSEITVSVPRLRPSGSGFQPARPVTDAELTRLICALRLLLPDAGIVMSTRESARLRDALVRVGVTHTSAGSHADPGGYTEGGATPQFDLTDTRPAQEVVASLKGMGYDVVWKDWDRALVPSVGASTGTSDPRRRAAGRR